MVLLDWMHNKRRYYNLTHVSRLKYLIYIYFLFLPSGLKGF